MHSGPGPDLHDSEARFREIIERNADAILIIRQDGMICFANPAAEELLGRPSHQIAGAMLGLPVAAEDDTEIDLPRPDGDTRIAEMRVAATIWDGAPMWLASLRDITERKRATEALQFLSEAGRSLAGTLDFTETVQRVAELAVMHLADWCTIDLKDRQLVHRAAITHADSSKAELARSLEESWLPNWTEARGLSHVLATSEPEILEDCDRDPIASYIASPSKRALIELLGCRSAMIVPLSARGRILGAMMFVCASSTKRYSTEELRLAQELALRAALAIDNARLYDQAQTAVRQRDEFLAMLAHELRNPLAAVLNAVEVMRKASDSPRTLERAEDVIERQGRHMAHLLDDLLDISRVTRGKIELRKHPFDLLSMIHDSVEANRPLVQSRKHHLNMNLGHQPLWVMADPTRLDQVFTNLLNNAAKYTAEGGTIGVSVSSQDGQAVVKVSDTGAGISADDLPHIFDLFVQAARPLDRSQGGLGIGLTLVKELVEMHGGSVSVHSDGVGRGSEFTVKVPLASPPQLAGDSQSRRPGADGRRKVVVVEDNADSRDMLKMLLTLDGHDVAVAEDGRQGFELISQCRPEVALIDIGLPKMDGYELAQCLRRDGQNQEIFLIALTGYGQPEDRQRALDAGFDHHMIKPVNFAELSNLFPRCHSLRCG